MRQVAWCEAYVLIALVPPNVLYTKLVPPYEYQNDIVLGPKQPQPLRKMVLSLDQCVVHSYAQFLSFACAKRPHDFL